MCRHVLIYRARISVTKISGGRQLDYLFDQRFRFGCTLLSLNPLSPNSDQDQISPNNIHTLSRDKL